MELELRKGIDHTGICAVFWCHDGNGRYLLAKRSKNCRDECGTWESPGGSLDFGEAPDEAMARELEEEFGCTDFEVDEVLMPHSIIRHEKHVQTHWIAFIYILRVEAKNIKICEPDKIDDVGWFTLSNLPEPLHQATGMEIQKFRDILIKYSN